jgi:hypothetical protein
MLRWLYLILGAGIVGFYGLVALCGWEFGDPRQRYVPPTSSSSWTSSGGSRSSGSGFSGFHGGK